MEHMFHKEAYYVGNFRKVVVKALLPESTLPVTLKKTHVCRL